MAPFYETLAINVAFANTADQAPRSLPAANLGGAIGRTYDNDIACARRRDGHADLGKVLSRSPLPGCARLVATCDQLERDSGARVLGCDHDVEPAVSRRGPVASR